MDSAGSPSNTVAPALRRVIPACYDDESERWALETSGWTRYSWDIGAENDENLACNELSPSFNASASEQRPLEPSETSLEAYKKAQDASEYYSPALDLFGIGLHGADVSTLVSMNTPERVQANPLPVSSQPSVPKVIEPHEYVRLPGVDNLPSAIAPSLLSGSSGINGLRARPATPSISPAPVSTPRTRMLSPYSPSPTPALSPSGSSICSSEDVQIDASVPIIQGLSYDQGPFYSRIAPQKTFEPALDDQFSFQSHVKYTFPHVVSPQTTLPTIASIATVPEHSIAALPVEEVRMPTHGIPDLSGQPLTTTSSSKSTVRPKRNTNPRTKRAFQPYKRKRQVRESSPNSIPAEGELVCDECGYKQNPGAGCRRSFKRHLETHERYKVHEWRCRGQLQPDGTYFGGCNNTFSRRDALNRHVRTSRVCYSELEPMEYIRRKHSGADGK